MPSPEPDLSTPPPMFTEAQIRRLKVAVIAMGLVLLLGFLTVIGRIVYLVSRQPSALPPDRAIAGVGVKTDLDLPLPAGAAVRHVALDGNRIAVHYDSPQGGGIAVVDLATGAVVSLIRLVPEVKR